MRRLLLRSSALLSFLAPGCSGEPEPPEEGYESRALGPRETKDAKRFRRLRPDESGLAFAHHLKAVNNLPYVYQGSGLAVGDYDADGLPDVYLLSQDGPNKLFRQTAPLRFEDVTAIAGDGLDGGDAWGTAASFADLDGDGDLDLFLCNLESSTLCFRNEGDGTFTECARAWGLDVVAASTGVATADYDRDGDLDVYLLTNRLLGATLPAEFVAELELPAAIQKTREELFPPYPTVRNVEGRAVLPSGYEDFYMTIGPKVFVAGQADRLLRNEGGGRFVEVTEAAGVKAYDNGLSCTFWDYDDDGWPDLYVANDLESPDRLYRNQRDGTFREVTGEALPHTAYYGMGCDFGDLDNDGLFDFCVADMSSTTHFMSKMLMGNMDENRWFLMNAEPPQKMRNALFVNTGTGRFLEAAQMAHLASTDWTWSVRFVDLDEDGRLDFHASNGIPLYEDNPDTVAEFKRLWSRGDQREALAMARSIPSVAQRNIARRQVGDLEFADVAAEWGLDDETVSYGAVFADLDRDGDLDLIVNHRNEVAGLYENTTSGTHRLLVSLHGDASNRQGVGSKITLRIGDHVQVRMVSPTRGYMSAGEAVEHFGLGSATRIDSLAVRWPDGTEQTWTDLEVDRQLTFWKDPAIRSAKVPTPDREPWFESGVLDIGHHRERDFDDYAVQPLLPHRLSRLGPGLAVGDVDGDGLDDLWIGGAAGHAGTLARSKGDGTFAEIDGPWARHGAAEGLGALFFDADGDGDQDLYVVHGGIEAMHFPGDFRDRLYLNDGGGGFTNAPADALPDLRLSGSSVAAADFDHDGDLDLFVGTRVAPGRYPEAPGSVLLRNLGGRFEDATAAVCPQLAEAGMVTGGIWTDVDADGWLDLVVAANWQPLRVHRNAAGERLVDVTEALGLADVRGLWHGVSSMRIGAATRPALVATNLGLNTKYHADASHPLRIYAADYDDDQELDVVEAKSSGGALLPVRGRSCSSAAMPFLAERFPTFESFAQASLPEIYGEDLLRAATMLEARELRHLLLQPADPGYVFEPLTRRAQIAPGFGVGISDFDGDGVLDLLMAQNSFSPEPETGRFDGGLGAVLRGSVGGGLEWIAPRTSGVVMPEDAAAVVVFDVDGNGTPDVVCATNDGPVRVFRNRGAVERWCTVRLVGGRGNPTAVGAVVRAERADGSSASQEVQAGSSYLSQSSARLHFGGDVRRVVAAWPDGSVSELAVAPGRRKLVLERR